MCVTAVRLLGSLCLLAIIVQAQNCSRPVGGPNMDLKGNDVLLKEFPEGTKVTFACNPGYVSIGGSPSITCRTGNWSPLGMNCERRNCGPVEEVEYGQIDYQPGTEFGDKAVVTCNTGYHLVGKNTLYCGVQGWEGRPPVCEVVQCEAPPQIVDGSFSPVKPTYEYADVVQYTCKKDYILNGSKDISCSDDETFKPDPPKCIMVKCVEPEIPNGFWSSGARPPYGYLSTVILECSRGYRMTGRATQTCGINNQWVPGLPQCIAQPKPTTPTTPTTTTTTTTTTPRILTESCEDPKKISPQVTVSRHPPYRHSDLVTVSCPSGDKQGRQLTVTCRENGLWVPDIPKCEPEDNGGGVNKPALIVGIVVFLVVIILAVAWLLVFRKKRKGARRGNTDKEATNEGEDVALS